MNDVQIIVWIIIGSLWWAATVSIVDIISMCFTLVRDTGYTRANKMHEILKKMGIGGCVTGCAIAGVLFAMRAFL